MLTVLDNKINLVLLRFSEIIFSRKVRQQQLTYFKCGLMDVFLTLSGRVTAFYSSLYIYYVLLNLHSNDVKQNQFSISGSSDNVM